MKLNKKVVESAAIFAFAGLLSITAVTNSENTVAKNDPKVANSEATEKTVIANTSLEDEGVAGVTAKLYEYQQRAAEELISINAVDAEFVTAYEDDVVTENIQLATVSELEAAQKDSEADEEAQAGQKESEAEADEEAQVAQKDSEAEADEEAQAGQKESEADEEAQAGQKDSEAEADEDAQAAQSESDEEDSDNELKKDWSDKLMADVDEFLYVRAENKSDSSIVGKLYKGDRALIVKKGKTWTQIESGSVSGYVKNEYCVMGEDALDYAKKNCGQIATITIDGLRIREEQDENSSIITALASGEKLKVKKNADTKDGWIAVIYDDKTRYVCEDYVTISYDTGKAVTLEEEQAAYDAASQAQSDESSSSSGYSQKNGVSKSQGSSVPSSTDDVTLLAALIQCEAGGCSYDCQLAVGSVVVNRVKSGAFPNSVYKVIYQKGQFGPASSGKLAGRLRKGVSSTARRAAQAALSGTDNTNGAKYFKLASSGHKGVKYGPIVFY